MDRRRVFIAGLTNKPIRYILRDDFTNTVAAGSVNGSYATDGINLRTVIDTNSKLSILAGTGASYATGGVGVGDPGMWYPSMARVAGRALLSGMNQTSGAAGWIGWDSNTSGALVDGIRMVSTTLSVVANLTTITVGTVTVGSLYYVATILNTAGAWFLIKGGTEYPNWTLLYSGNGGTVATVYPSMPAVGTSTVYSSPKVRIPQATYIIPALVADAFTRANGSLGTTGGAGTLASGGTGLTWTSQAGTWGISSNKAVCSALSGGIGVATVNAGTPNVVVEMQLSRSAGSGGLCLRYTDANNYIKVVHNGTNLQVIEVVGGTPNTLINTATTYNAAFRMEISLSDTKIRAYYNEALIGSEATTAVTSGNNHGLFTDDTGATFDNFIVWAKGNGGEYSSLSRFLA